MSQQSEALKRNFIKPLICAGVGSVMTVAEGFPAFDISEKFPLIGGWELSPMQYGAIIGLSSCFLVESLNNIFLGISKDARLQNAESFVLHSAGAIGAWILIPSFLAGGNLPSRDAMMQLGKVGFISEIFAQWVQENFIEDGSFGQDVLDFI